MKRKIGDSVTILAPLPIADHGAYQVDRAMEEFEGRTATIVGYKYDSIRLGVSNGYRLDVDGGKFGWTDSMFESETGDIARSLIDELRAQGIELSVGQRNRIVLAVASAAGEAYERGKADGRREVARDVASRYLDEGDDE